MCSGSVATCCTSFPFVRRPVNQGNTSKRRTKEERPDHPEVEQTPFPWQSGPRLSRDDRLPRVQGFFIVSLLTKPAGESQRRRENDLGPIESCPEAREGPIYNKVKDVEPGRVRFESGLRNSSDDPVEEGFIALPLPDITVESQRRQGSSFCWSRRVGKHREID